MKITITVYRKTPIHIEFRVFVNGALSGSLVLRNEEFEQFMAILQPNKIRDESVPSPTQKNYESILYDKNNND